MTPPALPARLDDEHAERRREPLGDHHGSSDSPFNHAFVADPAGVSDNALVSPTIAVPPGVSRLTFRHLFTTDAPFDGGVLEIAIAGGRVPGHPRCRRHFHVRRVYGNAQRSRG